MGCYPIKFSLVAGIQWQAPTVTSKYIKQTALEAIQPMALIGGGLCNQWLWLVAAIQPRALIGGGYPFKGSDWWRLSQQWLWLVEAIEQMALIGGDYPTNGSDWWRLSNQWLWLVGAIQPTNNGFDCSATSPGSCWLPAAHWTGGSALSALPTPAV